MNKNNKYSYVCGVCGLDNVSNQPKQRFCSKQCNDKFFRRKGTYQIAKSSIGSMSEMMICCEMLKRGYSVFATVSNSSFCDVVAIKDKDIMLIEVRTGYKDWAGKLTYPKKLHTKISNPTHYGICSLETNEVFIREISKEELNKYGE